jgi:biopolymer transport protein ExbD
MLRRYRDPKLFSDFNTLAFASVMGMMVFVLLLPFITISHHHPGVSVDIPHVLSPVSLPGADKEDAMKVTVTRDGMIFFRDGRINAADLPKKIAEHLKDRGAERKVYIAADMRARWANVKTVLDGIRSAGILRVAFLANQRRS